MSSTAPDLPGPTTIPEPNPEPGPTQTVPTEDPPTEEPTEPPTQQPPTEPPSDSDPSTDQPTAPAPPETTDDPTTKQPPPPPPPAETSTKDKTSSNDEPTETSAPTKTSANEPSVTSGTSDNDSSSKQSETIITSVITTNGDTGALTTVVLTSTAAAPIETVSITGTSTSDAGSALQTGGSDSDDSGGLSAGGTIAVAVVVPVVAVAAIIIGLIMWWRRRESNKRLEQQRKSEIEDYGYNPNNDPTLPSVGGSAFGDGSEMREDNSGYRGWGTTTTSRKLSTNLSSGPGMGNTTSENGSNRAYRHAGSPSDGTAQYSDGYGGRISGDSETIGALGMGPPTSYNKQNRDIARGPSNASSANSGGHRSEESEDGTLIDGPGGPGYYEDNPYYNHGQSSQSPYGDGAYAGGHPVIRDVTARRNTRIESPSVIPQQGNSGISQNF